MDKRSKIILLKQEKGIDKELFRWAVAVFLLCTMSVSLYANSFQPPLPELTTLDEIKRETVEDGRIVIYSYYSELSQKEIVQFYKEHLFASGVWKELKAIPGHENLFHNTITFMKGGKDSLTIVFRPSSGKKIRYEITVAEFDKLAPLPTRLFHSPRRLDFMPVYPQAAEFVYNTFYTPMIGVGYLSRSEVASVTDFYVRDMPRFGWRLERKKSHQGTYDVSRWIKIVDPYTKAVPNIEAIGFSKLVPLLRVEGNTLTFIQEGEKCTITIYKFPDIVAAAEGTVFDMSSTAQYGTTLICVYYFYKRQG